VQVPVDNECYVISDLCVEILIADSACFQVGAIVPVEANDILPKAQGIASYETLEQAAQEDDCSEIGKIGPHAEWIN
jgi:hypothetical protein